MCWCSLLSIALSPSTEVYSRGLQSWLHVTAKYKIVQMLGLIFNQQNQNPQRWVFSWNPCLCLQSWETLSVLQPPAPSTLTILNKGKALEAQDCFSCSQCNPLCWHDQHPISAQRILLTIMGHSPSSQMEHHQPSSKVYKTFLPYSLGPELLWPLVNLLRSNAQ